MSSIFLISLIFVGISFLVSSILKSKFNTYSKVPLRGNLSGREVAQKMLRDSGIYDVQVTSVEGHLTDHYDPTNKTVNLSAEVYSGQNISAAAVAAHECGHAVQHAKSYKWLKMRSALVPVVQFSSNIVQWVLLAGIIMIQMFPGLLLVGIALFAATTVFSFITLPVEFDASRRALAWLNTTNIATGDHHDKAKDALKWAAMTYVVAAIASLVTLIQYIFIFLSGSRDRE
ncbi:zinc metallopeptidase [Segetibacter sp.]|jgi:Zn-dependent membrane protease YugP|uniref:zinc metallopeptidase n=1 Tax=Segetibacter sp. TaxID=2231182 RepID=UPI002638CF85|nr:zinc metallopeptidase [Segetibacter sp.]MCW3082102.1 zinc metallopeptidase [Segetibacter sp.]